MIEQPNNFHQVSADLYRSAQPSAENFLWLQQQGIRTVINLRMFNLDLWYARRSKLWLRHISMKAWHPEHEDALAFLSLVTNPFMSPVLVHCRHGSDRTGAMVALYRIVVEGWDKTPAIKEMLLPKYGFHAIWQDLVDWVETVDVARYRRYLGLKQKYGGYHENA